MERPYTTAFVADWVVAVEVQYLHRICRLPEHFGLSFTIIFAAYEDIQEGHLVVLFLLHRKLNVGEDGVEMFLECQHLIPFDDDEGIIHIPGPGLRSLQISTLPNFFEPHPPNLRHAHSNLLSSLTFPFLCRPRSPTFSHLLPSNLMLVLSTKLYHLSIVIYCHRLYFALFHILFRLPLKRLPIFTNSFSSSSNHIQPPVLLLLLLLPYLNLILRLLLLVILLIPLHIVILLLLHIYSSPLPSSGSTF
ncbi:hypothetical protein SprV_0501738400 [Sparganum proliferum]